ncbi:2'-5' RNA ligase family protein [Spirochaeta lutea]|uniref:RNA 2',3'-cyclic phosphodiesterase n=1 Tax=Spirochaeta lutea TaxID=1480694 RepID=A0A098QVI7_9SPIO|nr:2'-5' RNA ligase family protein [Spirochaeta lutea]KGE71403.1 hypothetical protein DC28_11430 [Spirochaeta lutea]
MKTSRLFFAWEIQMPPGRNIHLISSALSDLTEGQDPLFRPVMPRNYHVTAIFLGNQPDELIPYLSKCLMEFKPQYTEPLLVPVRGIGGMPSLQKPNSFHISLEDPGKRLESQKAALEHRLLTMKPDPALQWSPENRPFRPHLTLGYKRKHTDYAELAEVLTLFGVSWQALVPELRKGLSLAPVPRLFKSTLLPEGPRYQTLA